MNRLKTLSASILLFFGSLSLLPGRASQALAASQDSVPYQFVLVEDFTGTWCNNCVGVATYFSKLNAQIDNLALIGYHTAETRQDVRFLYNMDVYHRSCYYDTIRSIPAIFVNGKPAKVNGSSTAEIDTAIDQALRKKTPYALDFSVRHWADRSQNRDSFNLQVKIRKTAYDTARNLRLHIVFAQSHLPFPWYIHTEVNHATTFMIPDGWGTEVRLDETGTASYDFSFAKSYQQSRFRAKDGEIIAFIQDETILGYDTLYSGSLRPKRDNTILQAAKIDLSSGTYTELPPEERALPDFQNWTPEIADRESVQYFDNTFGTDMEYLWEFEGGSPQQSTEANPVVRYNEAGNFAVSLTVTKNGESLTTRKENAVRVLNIKPKFTVSPAMVKPNNKTTLTLTSDADSCEWRFFGGDPFIAYGKEVQVKYPMEGEYDVQITTFYRSPVSGTMYTYDSTAVNAIIVSQCAGNEAGESIDNTIYISKISAKDAVFSVIVESGVDFEYLDVFSLGGQRIRHSFSPVFDLSALPDGLYLVNVKLKGKMPKTFKIIK